MATSRADKNATGPLHLSSSSMSHPFPISSILTLYSPNMRFIQHRSQPESSQLAWCMTASHPPLEEMWPRGFMNDLMCATQITLCTLGHRSSFETGQCVRQRTHNGMANCLFCSNDEISEWFSTSVGLIIMLTLAWHPHNFYQPAENCTWHDQALLV